MKCFETIAIDARFKKVEPISTFDVKREDGIDSYMGVIHCFV